MSIRMSAFLVAAMVFAAPARSEDVTAKTVVATVNGTEITLGHMIAARKTLPAQYQALADDVLFEGILDQIIQQSALAQSAGTTIKLRDALVMENERRAYLAGSVLDDAAAAAVTDAALEAAYAERFASAEPSKEFSAAHILVETEEEAKALKAQLDEGADFTALAKEKSTGPSGPNGGELGWFGLGAMVKPFEDAVLTLEPGQVSDPVQTQFGWHVVKLNETRMAEAPSLDAVRAELQAEIQQKAVEALVADITKAATVEKMVEGIDPALIKNEALLND